MRIIAALLLCLALTGTAQAAEPRFGLPIDCEMGRDCFIQQYVDADPGPGSRDYTCGPMSYDGHRGTDFRVRDLEAMREGVAVIAAADGIIHQTRDGMDDIDVSTIGRAALNGRDCGNRVAIDHGGGWFTDYCHLRKGSVRVKKGDRVRRGDALGLVGMSGAAAFPHVHMSVVKGRTHLDPFRFGAPPDACGGSYGTLWDPAVAKAVGYRLGGLLSVGLTSDAAVGFDDIKAGLGHQATISRNSPAIALWANMFVVLKGDVLRMRITGPSGETVFRNELDPHPKTQAQAYRLGGKRLHTPLPPGTYTGLVQMVRDGRVYDAKTISAEIR